MTVLRPGQWSTPREVALKSDPVQSTTVHPQRPLAKCRLCGDVQFFWPLHNFSKLTYFHSTLAWTWVAVSDRCRWRRSCLSCQWLHQHKPGKTEGGTITTWEGASQTWLGRAHLSPVHGGTQRVAPSETTARSYLSSAELNLELTAVQHQIHTSLVGNGLLGVVVERKFHEPIS
jgi:hypothetical protein